MVWKLAGSAAVWGFIPFWPFMYFCPLVMSSFTTFYFEATLATVLPTCQEWACCCYLLVKFHFVGLVTFSLNSCFLKQL